MDRRIQIGIITCGLILGCSIIGLYFWFSHSGKEGPITVVGASYCEKKPASPGTNVCGEDAYKLSIHTGSAMGYSVWAVADGVGGWSGVGKSRSDAVAKVLVEVAVDCQQKGNNSTAENVIKCIKTDLEKENKKSGLPMHPGSSTLNVSALNHQNGKLKGINIGDSATWVIRGDAVVFKTQAGTDGFNKPNQIGFGESNVFSCTPVCDEPFEFTVLPGDKIISASDGLFDNVDKDEIIHILTSLPFPFNNFKEGSKRDVPLMDIVREKLQSTAKILVGTAMARAGERYSITPFTKMAMEAKVPVIPYGGKLDDISVVVILVDKAGS